MVRHRPGVVVAAALLTPASTSWDGDAGPSNEVDIRIDDNKSVTRARTCVRGSAREASRGTALPTLAPAS